MNSHKVTNNPKRKAPIKGLSCFYSYSWNLSKCLDMIASGVIC